MELPRTTQLAAINAVENTKKRQLPHWDESDFEQPYPIKKLSKNFEHSVGFSQTTFSHSKSIPFAKGEQKDQAQNSHQPVLTLNFSTQLRKAQVLTVKEDKFQKFKSLLPNHLVAKLHPEYQLLLKMAEETDKLLSKKVILNYMESFENIRNEIIYEMNIDLSFGKFAQINFLLSNFYCFFMDPYENLVIGLPQKFEALPLRKYQLRERLYNHVKSSLNNSQEIENYYEVLPEKEYTVAKKSTFFPTVNKKTKTKKAEKISQALIQKLEGEIKEKEKKIGEKKLSKEQACESENVDIFQFVDELQKLFKRHKVTHIFKTNIVDWFLKQRISVEKTSQLIEKTVNSGVFLYQKKVPNRSVIYELKIDEKVDFLERIKQSI